MELLDPKRVSKQPTPLDTACPKARFQTRSMPGRFCSDGAVNWFQRFGQFSTLSHAA
ncbi:hypothetical protein D3C77_254170 [compost metagenome]